MAYSVTLNTLQQRVLQRTNLEGATSFITLPELTDLINISIAKWYDEVRGTTWNGAYYRAPFVITTTAFPGNFQVNPPSNAIYQLPADYLATTSVDAFISPSVTLTCKAFQEEQRNMYRFWTGAVGWFLGTTVYYQIQGAGNLGTPYIVLMPPPQAAFQLQVNYVPTAPQLSEPEDAIDSINGWEEFIILDSSIMCLMKCGRGEEIPQFSARMEEEKQRIRRMAPRRDMQTAERVHEMDTDNDGWMF
jgi:hypothetical protein